MAFAAAFAHPASSRFIPPGAASLWLPPRLFPALLWLAQCPTAPLAAVSACTAAVSAGSSPSLAAAPTRGRAGTEAGATGIPSLGRQDAGGTRKPRQRVPGEPPRLHLELRWLFSRCKPLPDEDFFVALRIELGQRAWSLEHAIGAPRLAWSPEPGTESALEKRRARLVAEVHLGLTMVETAPTRFSRPVRNLLLTRQAQQIGRCLADLLNHPDAGSMADELTHLFDALQRRR